MTHKSGRAFLGQRRRWKCTGQCTGQVEDESRTRRQTLVELACREAVKGVAAEAGDSVAWCGRDYADKLRQEGKSGLARPLPPKQRPGAGNAAKSVDSRPTTPGEA